MLSECARMTTTAEACFRVDYPNSSARRIKIIALDRAAERVVRRLAQGTWNSAIFMTTAGGGRSHSVRDWLRNLAGEALDLLDQLSAADLVVTVSTAGENSQDCSVIAEACKVHGITMTALLIDPLSAPEPLLLETMMPLRQHASMLVVAKAEDYVEAMLTALRA